MRGPAAMFVVSVAIAHGACAPELGPCDEARARTIVYGPGGTPVYAGQAVFVASCAQGACHAEAATGQARRGAPFTLNFDAAPIRVLSDGTATAEATDVALTETLRRGRTSIFQHRRGIYEAVLSSYMPPPVAGVRPGAELANYRTFANTEDRTGTALEPLDAIRTRDTLRNWLSCGAPFVERLEGQGRGIGYVEPRRATRPEPTWASLYANVIRPNCATSTCHGAGELNASGGLDLGSEQGAYASLCGGDGCPGVPARFRTPTVARCPSARPQLIVPGDPNASFFYRKLSDTTPPCGARMPLSQQPLYPEELTAIAEWIRTGATRNEESPASP